MAWAPQGDPREGTYPPLPLPFPRDVPAGNSASADGPRRSGRAGGGLAPLSPVPAPWGASQPA